MSSEEKLPLFSPIEPFDHGWLAPEDGHQIYYEQCGKPDGVPILFLHGGPGSGFSTRHRQLFDPHRIRLILFDQRGCGKSLGLDPIKANYTNKLIADIERLRQYLRIPQWFVTGGSWGSTLALAYGIKHAEFCLGLVLRSIFLCRASDINWFFKDAGAHFPWNWLSFVEEIPAKYRVNPKAYFFETILGDDDVIALKLAKIWAQWEHALNSTTEQENPDPKKLLKKYRIQAHYLLNEGFLPEGGILNNLLPLTKLDIRIIHGAADLICLPEGAIALHRELPQSRLYMLENEGHHLFTEVMVSIWIETIEKIITKQ